MNISIIGLGFVGLTAALGLADKGFCVRGFDIDTQSTKQIASGTVPFLEYGLAEALSRNLNNNFFVSPNVQESVKSADIIFFCVGTPCSENGKADLKYLFLSIDSIINIVRSDCVLVIKSTVPPGTLNNEILPYVRALGFIGSVAVNPEFLREGSCWRDFTIPDRIVCGVETGDEKARNLLSKLFKSFNAPIHFVTPDTAEFTKYLSNSLLATLISFSNEMTEIAEESGGVCVKQAFKILHEDNRLQDSGIAHYIYPGCGYGGYCLPKDTAALSAHAKTKGVVPKILDEVIAINNAMPAITALKIERAAQNKNAIIGILGLSFKPNSDDVRDSQAAKIIRCLRNNGYDKICVYDPVATENFRRMYGLKLIYCKTKEQVCINCDVIALVTTWDEFSGIDKLYPDKKFIDCRYFL